MSCERLLHEYPTKVKELLFLERRVSKFSKVRDIAIYRRCYVKNLGQRIFGSPTRIPTNQGAYIAFECTATYPQHISTFTKKSQHLPLRVHYVLLFRLRT
jgi:hypothetical protein